MLLRQGLQLKFGVGPSIKPFRGPDLISIRKTATELERLDELKKTAVSCYALAICATEQYAIELDWEQAAHFPP
jgi:hypothetical protein